MAPVSASTDLHESLRLALSTARRRASLGRLANECLTLALCESLLPSSRRDPAAESTERVCGDPIAHAARIVLRGWRSRSPRRCNAVCVKAPLPLQSPSAQSPGTLVRAVRRRRRSRASTATRLLEVQIVGLGTTRPARARACARPAGAPSARIRVPATISSPRFAKPMHSRVRAHLDPLVLDDLANRGRQDRLRPRGRRAAAPSRSS